MLVIISSTICEQHATILSKDFISKNLNVLSTYVSIKNLCVSLEPSGGSRVSRRGGCGLLRRLRFVKFVCQNERIGSLTEGARRMRPPGSANGTYKKNTNQKSVFPVADPGFPVGRGMDLIGGRGLPRRLCFENFVCQNERIWTLRGACAGHAP